MAWLKLLGRKESTGQVQSTGASATPGRRGFLRRWIRRVAWLGAGILAFGVIVSVAGLIQAPEARLPAQPDSSVRIQEITRLYPVTMARVATPRTVEEIAAAVAGTAGPIAIGGGRYSMGGQTATPDGLQLDMHEFHGVVAFDPAARTVTVRSGTRWRELQQAIDSAGLSIKIMQTYDNFTVGGALSVNAHGRYIGEGPLVRSVRAITLILADGKVVKASPTENAELFYGAIGGYGALGVIADVTLDLADNTRVRRDALKVPLAEYPAWFRANIRDDRSVVFHNADIYLSAYATVHAVTYRTTDSAVTVSERIQLPDQASWTHRMAYRIMASGHTGLWIREHLFDPFLFRGHPVSWRNHEASYDVSELEPSSRLRTSYVLQEYFVPVDSFAVFLPEMRRIFQAHHTNVINVSIRHALPDPGTMLAWAPTEVFAFVVYYRQGTKPEDRREVARWTRELIDAVVKSGGRYYLPYQPVATREQFHRAYPRATELLALKRRVDPSGKFTNVLWDLYAPGSDGQMPPVTAARMPSVLQGEVQLSLDSLTGYARNQAAAWLTHPEWDLVYSSESYARWLAEGQRPSGFPYVRSVGTFWRSYLGCWRTSSEVYPTPVGTHVMLWVIGISTAVEYGIKGLYENTVGRLAEWTAPDQPTAEEVYAAKVSRDYADLIALKGWYEFDFWGALGGLWKTIPMTGPGFIRKWERRFALSGEYTVKAVYAWLIGLGTGAAYTPDDLTRSFVVAGWSDSVAQQLKSLAPELTATQALDRGYTILSVPRYAPFRDALLAMADHAGSLRIAEISGCNIITLTGSAPVGWQVPARVSVAVAYAVPAEAGRVRALLSVHVRDLLGVLAGMKRAGEFRVDHIYDY